jgi:Flp pilus assembly pilin Flp
MAMKYMAEVTTFATEDSGATSIEYAFIGVFLTVAIVTSLPAMRDQLVIFFNSTGNHLTTYANSN